MNSEIRESTASAFDYACELTKLPSHQLRLRLSRILRREVPISHTALLDWRRGVQPVDAEVLAAVCQLAGAEVSYRADGSARVEIDVPTSHRLPRAAGAGLYASLMVIPGGLLVLAAVVMWSTGASFDQVVHTFQSVAHTISTSTPISGPVSGVLAAPSAAAATRRAVSSPTAVAGSATPVGVSAASRARQNLPAPGQTSAGGVVAAEPSGAPAASSAPQTPTPAAPVNLPSLPQLAPPSVSSVDPLPSALPSPSLP